MLRPSRQEIVGEDANAYEFVIAVAKRAREINDEYKEKEELQNDSPVSESVREYAKGDCKYYKDK